MAFNLFDLHTAFFKSKYDNNKNLTVAKNRFALTRNWQFLLIFCQISLRIGRVLNYSWTVKKLAIFANYHPFYSKSLALMIFPDALDNFSRIIGKICQTTGIILVCLIHLQQCIFKVTHGYQNQCSWKKSLLCSTFVYILFSV